MEKGIVIGLMSGTSLDGLDIAACRFDLKNLTDYELIATETIDYSNFWKKRLEQAMALSGQELTRLDRELGLYYGECVNAFIKKNKIIADLISSHGHTVFHQPENQFTLQIGSGIAIHSITGITTICDFRSLDVALGGQGAPLVPIGDELIFTEYDQCLNLGGIANISARKNTGRIAFDISAFNIVFNGLSQDLQLEYDESGNLARSGKVDEQLLKTLNALPFYKLPSPKSLGRERINQDIFTLLKSSSLSVADKLRTCSRHFAEKIAHQINSLEGNRVLVTGGGAFNQFFIEQLKELTSKEIILPTKEIINFKEAIVFALLGFLRINKRINTLSAVTGAKRDSSGGLIIDKIS